ncbi:PH domain-containing protein [Listeria sp. PSOL-1]|uniref:PH domain-containing protein n=1 Tax=Listeria sp. PSOL-1 TaxID=1844999 RepID=UPI0013D288DC|nr:PH domain-containing protein [Listeria sp. PSOL-1]
MELKKLENQLPKKIKKVWHITYGVWGSILVVITLVTALIFSLTDVSFWWNSIAVFITLFYFIFIYRFIIPFRFKRFSYQICHDEIEIQQGIIFRSRTLIPMIRIQHVETSQGPLLRKEKLMALHITTAAKTHIIEAVNEDEADQLRRHILELVKVAKEDV